MEKLNLSYSPRRSSIITSFLYLINNESNRIQEVLGFIPTKEWIITQTTRDLDRLEDMILESIAA